MRMIFLEEESALESRKEEKELLSFIRSQWIEGWRLGENRTLNFLRHCSTHFLLVSLIQSKQEIQ